MTSQRKVVVVGVDGSAESWAAVSLALRNAAARREAVRVVAAVPAPEMWASIFGPAVLSRIEDPLPGAEKAAQKLVDDVVTELGVSVHGVPVTVDAVSGPAAKVLLDAAADATELVVGHRGRGGIRSALLGSVALSCVLQAPCPVTVVRARPDAA